MLHVHVVGVLHLVQMIGQITHSNTIPGKTYNFAIDLLKPESAESGAAVHGSQSASS